MEPEQGGFRGCYIHPRRPAIRNCINCERPICMLCEEESGDALLCLPCKEALEAEEASASTDPLKSAKFVAPPKRSAAMVGEVTILSDGTIVAPEVEEEPGEEAGTESTEDAVRESGARQEREPEETAEAPPLVHTPAVKRPIERRPFPRAPMDRARPARAPAPAPEAEVEAEAVPIRERRAVPPARAREKKPSRAAAVREIHTGPVTQFAFSLPYGIGAGIVVASLWLLFALIAKQWSQIAVFTLGIVVPWAFYKGSTMRKDEGERVWTKSPQPLLLAIPSVVVVAAVTPGMEWLAYKVIYGANPAKLPFSDFMERYFKGLDWVLIVAGVALAFLIPFMLKSGEGWRKPAVRKPVEEVAGDEEDHEELSEDESVSDESEHPDRD